MPPKYTNITLDQMSGLLETLGFEYTPNYSINQFAAQEYIFQKYITRSGIDYIIRIYTSISIHTDDSRDVGSDAIRTVVIGNGAFFGEGRTNRTQGWMGNLQQRINHWDELFKLCPQCNNVLRERVGKYGAFYGCSTFPKCGYTEKKG